MRSIPASLVAAALLVSGLHAQTATTISPKGAAANGNTNNNIPYSWPPAVYQQIFDGTSFTHGTTAFPCTSVNYRMNRSFANGRYGGQTIEISMWLSQASTGTTSTSYSRTFASNVDASTRRQVISRKKFKLPVLSNQNFDIKFPFDSGVFILNPAAGATVQEVWNWGNSNCTNFTYPLDAASSSGGLGTGTSRVYAYTFARGMSAQTGTHAGCPNAANLVPTHSVSNTGHLVVGCTALAFRGNSRISAATPGVFLLGATPLNVNIPGTSCNLMTSIDFLAAALSATNGQTDFAFGIPNDAALANVTFYTQQWWMQASANLLGWFSTRGLTNTIAAAPPRPDTYTAATGATTTYGLVTQFSR